MFDRFLPIAAIVLLSCWERSLPAQAVSFLAHRDIPIGAGCCAIASGDFDGDGKLDLVVGYGMGSLALLPGDGVGGFKPRVELTTFGGPVQKLIASDLNRDGKLDLLVTVADRTYVLLGAGDGTFQTLPQSVATTFPHLIFVMDANGDGIPDLIVSLVDLALCNGVQVLLGNGDGTFQKPSACIVPREGMSSRVVVGDFNGDGHADFAWASSRSTGFIHIFLGNGDGTFRYGSFTGGNPPSVPGSGSIVQSLAAADVNQDGKLDLVVRKADGILIFLGKGDGTFREGFSNFDLRANPSAIRSLLIADFNGDGKPDIGTGNAVLLGNGDGTFQAARYLLTASPVTFFQAAAADLNGDGLPDLIYINYDINHDDFSYKATALSVLLNNTPGPPNSVVGYSAVTGMGPLSPDSIGSIYGRNLARITAVSALGALPTQLGGISLRMRDSTDTVRLAPLFYVSPSQINFLVPKQTAVGPVTLAIDDGSTPLVETANATLVSNIAPAIFTANGQGQGVAAATAVRILPDRSQQPLMVFNCAGPGHCTTVPIDLSGGHPVYLSLYGTGFRAAQSPEGRPPGATCQIEAGPVDAVVQFVGPQPTFPGLDQINILLPKLSSGMSSVHCKFSVTIAESSFLPFPNSNPVQIEIK